MEYLDIKYIRVKAGWSQAALATAIGVTQGTIARWERGIRPITVEQLYKISQVLNVDIRDFFGGVR